MDRLLSTLREGDGDAQVAAAKQLLAKASSDRLACALAGALAVVSSAFSIPIVYLCFACHAAELRVLGEGSMVAAVWSVCGSLFLTCLLKPLAPLHTWPFL